MDAYPFGLIDYFNLSENTNPQTLKQNLPQKILNLNGDFGILIIFNDLIIAAVDKKRSYPIYFTRTSRGVSFSNSASWLKDSLSNLKISVTFSQFSFFYDISIF